MRKNLLSVAVKGALGLTAAAIMVPAMPAFAQQDAEMVEEVVVTGSRIKRADLESSSPVSVINRDEMKVAGLTDVGDLLQSMPSMSGSPIGTTTNNGGNGSVQIDLRGLGVDRTLTLVNGRRTVDGGDYQTIPSAMIERVEILKDGASAVYGADAVAGVVNIITRKDFEGVEVDVQTADFFDMGSGAQDSMSIVTGKNFDGGNVVFGAEFVTQEAAYQSDAPWDFFQDSYYIYPEGCEKHPTRAYDGTAQGGCYPIGSSRIPEGRLKFANQGTYMNADGSGLTEFDGRTYNYAPVNFIQTPYDRTNIFAEANFDLADNVKFFTEIRGNFRESAQELAPQPYNSGTDPAYDGQFDLDGDGTLDAFHGISQDNYYLTQAALAAGLTPEPVVDARRRMVETSRTFEQEINQVQAVFGFEGSFNDMDWQASYNKGYRSRVDHDYGQFFGPNLSNAMGPSADLNNDGTPECYADINDASTLISGCVPMNFFGGAGSITQEMLDYVGVDLVDTYVTTQDIVDMSISGSAFQLPGGELGWAVGAGYWGQSYQYSPDSAKQKDEVTGNTGAGTEGSLYNANVYAELLAPVFDNGTQALDLKAGVRHDSYNIFGSDTTWQLGADFKVVDSLKFRATTGTVFRAPTISDLFAGEIDSFPTYSDPCDTNGALPAGCAQASDQQDSQVLAKVGGNRDLMPETGETFTAGLVFTPQLGAGDFSLTLDYWNTKIEEGISSLGVQYILDDCYVNQNAESCGLIQRRGDYSIAQIQDLALNVAEQGASGVDTEVRYTFDTEFGMFKTSVLWTHLIERTKVAFPGDEEEDLSGRYTDPTAQDGGAYAENKVNYSVAWNYDNLTVSYLGEFVDALDADTFCNCNAEGVPYIQSIDSVLYHDLIANYSFPTGTNVTFGATNLTNEEPPFIEVGFNATTDPATYRMFGRGYYLRATQSF